MDGRLQEFALPVPDIYIGYMEDNVLKRLGEPLTSCSPAVTVNGINLTTDPNQMWIGETPADTLLIFHFEFSQPIELKGIRIWNYNSDHEGSCSGLKRLKIFLDGLQRCDIIARKAPGEFLGNLDYGQFLSLVGNKATRLGSMKNRNSSDLPTVISVGDLPTTEIEGGNSYTEVCMVNQQYQTPVSR
jgi:hypothetical protein